MIDKQLNFWKGEFGNAYIERNTDSFQTRSARIQMWAKILANLGNDLPESILEVGSNTGINIKALKTMVESNFYALEPNELARKFLLTDQVVSENNILASDASNIKLPNQSIDLVFTSGVLIHIHPDSLEKSLHEIHRVAKKYIVCIEYFSDKIEEIKYRENRDVLFKRDFGSLYLDLFNDLKIIGCGFEWKRLTGLDNLTWWVFKRQ